VDLNDPQGFGVDVGSLGVIVGRMQVNYKADREKYQQRLTEMENKTAMLRSLLAGLKSVGQGSISTSPAPARNSDGSVKITPHVLEIIGAAAAGVAVTGHGIAKDEIRKKLAEFGHDTKPVEFAIRLGKVLRRQVARQTVRAEKEGPYTYYFKGPKF